MKKKLCSALIILGLLSAGASQAEIVKCVQPDGTVLYTDTVCAGSTEVPLELKPLPIVGPGKDEAAPAKPAKSTSSNVQQPANAVPRFESPSNLRLPNIPLPDISPLQVLGLYALMSVLCFGVFWLDKRRAEENEQRIPENVLHGLEWLGGWPGSLLAQHSLRHKNRKMSYQGVFWFIVFTHALLWIDYKLDHALWYWLRATALQLYALLRGYMS